MILSGKKKKKKSGFTYRRLCVLVWPFITVFNLQVIMCLHFLHAPQSLAVPPINQKQLLKHGTWLVCVCVVFFAPKVQQCSFL